MTGRHLLTACAGLGLLAAWVGCAAPAAPPQTLERGRKIDRATLEGFQRGVTTRKQALEILGPPARTSTDAQDGSTTCSWDYVHVDAQGSTAILTTLKFGPDDRLQIKMVNQSSHVRGSGRPPS
jgi:outer membrane protein assembly factor BamE (lipoprotein component of BamABCDE complex)